MSLVREGLSSVQVSPNTGHYLPPLSPRMMSNPLCTQLPVYLFVFRKPLLGQTRTWDHYLVCAPTPGGQDCEPKNETWPGNVPIHRVSKHMEGVWPWEMTGGVGNCGIGDGLHI